MKYQVLFSLKEKVFIYDICCSDDWQANILSSFPGLCDDTVVVNATSKMT